MPHRRIVSVALITALTAGLLNCELSALGIGVDTDAGANRDSGPAPHDGGSVQDAPSSDTGPSGTDASDSGRAEASAPDAGTADAGTADASTADAGSEAGTDAGPICTAVPSIAIGSGSMHLTGVALANGATKVDLTPSDYKKSGLMWWDTAITDASVGLDLTVVFSLTKPNSQPRGHGIAIGFMAASVYDGAHPILGLTGNNAYAALGFCGGNLPTARAVEFETANPDDYPNSGLFWRAIPGADGKCGGRTALVSTAGDLTRLNNVRDANTSHTLVLSKRPSSWTAILDAAPLTLAGAPWVNSDLKNVNLFISAATGDSTTRNVHTIESVTLSTCR